MNSAGIGGGEDGTLNSITINGGNIVAQGNHLGAGIGGGVGYAVGSIVITGGNIKASTGSSSANAVGSGGNTKDVTPVTDGVNDVVLTTLTLNGAADKTAITDVNGVSYGTQDVTTMDTDKLYFYLPANTVPSAIVAGNTAYVCNTNNVFTTSHQDEDDDLKCDLCGIVIPPAYVDGFYEISNANQLRWFASEVNAGNRTLNAKLTADIDLDGAVWEPICSTGLYYKTTTYADKGYEGIFDGNGHVISNFVLRGVNGTESTIGLFGTLSGTVKNLGVEDVVFELNGASDIRAAAIAGQMLDGSLIESCYAADCDLTPGSFIVAGIAACNYAGTIRNCFTSHVAVKANDRCGNLVSDTRGDISSTDRPGTVINCWTDANRVAGTQNGGLVSGCFGGVSPYMTSGMLVWFMNGMEPNGFWKQGETRPGFTGADVDFSNLSIPELANGVYQITSRQELECFCAYVNLKDPSANAILVNDIDLENTHWIPMGNISVPYTGTFDGNGKTISNFQLTVTTSGSWGLFGEAHSAVVKNFSISGEIIINVPESVSVAAGVIGAAYAPTKNCVIQNIHSDVNIRVLSGNANTIGGIAAYVQGNNGSPWYCVDIIGCSFGGTLDFGSNYVDCGGGIMGYCGYNSLVHVYDCMFDGQIISSCEQGGQIGGIFGYNRGSNLWTYDCLSTGNIEMANPRHTGAIAGRYLLPSPDYFFSNNLCRNNYYTGDLPAFSNTTDTEQSYHNIDIVDFEAYGPATAMAVTADQLASGEITWRLNNNSASGRWKQTLGIDAAPNFSGETVYYGYEKCGDTEAIYANSTLSDTMMEHMYTAVSVPPTCIEQGYALYTCRRCGHQYKSTFTDPIDHAYSINMWEPTCTEPGYTEYVCMTCGHSYSSDYVDALGHNYEDGICTVCGDPDESYVESAIKITAQPVDFVGLVGETATFTVTAEGEGLTYQWEFSQDGGATWQKVSSTTDSLSVEFKTSRLSYEYRCVITDAEGNSVTTNAVMMVPAEVEIVIQTQPVSHVGAVNDNVTFTVEATGNSLSYQWYFSTDGGETWAASGSPGNATATLRPILRAYRDGYQFYCQITDILGNSVESDVVSMSVKADDIVITRQPEPVEHAVLGQLYYFSVEAEGENLEYRWELSTDGGETWADSWNQGYNTATLGVRMNANRDGNLYRCKITSGLKIVAYSDAVVLDMQDPSAKIVFQSGNVFVTANKTATFTVEAEGMDLTYLWYRSNDKGASWNQTFLSGYNTNTLSFDANTNRAAMYMCKVTDGSGTVVWSSPVKLQVLSAELKILTQPEDVTCANGETAIFTVEAQGDTLKYQWYSSADGENWDTSFMTGYNTNEFSFVVNTSRAAKMYKCIITDAAGKTVETAPVKVTIQ